MKNDVNGIRDVFCRIRSKSAWMKHCRNRHNNRIHGHNRSNTRHRANDALPPYIPLPYIPDNFYRLLSVCDVRDVPIPALQREPILLKQALQRQTIFSGAWQSPPFSPSGTLHDLFYRIIISKKPHFFNPDKLLFTTRLPSIWHPPLIPAPYRLT